MKKIYHYLLAYICLTLCSSTCFSDTPATNSPYTPPFDEIVFDWSRTWAEVMQLVKKKHYQINDAIKAMSKAINEFLSHLDPHSAFLDPETYTRIMEVTHGKFYGIGVVIDNRRETNDKYLAIIDTIPDGPAAKAGIEPGDKIVEVAGKALDGMDTDAIIAKIKGERKTIIHLKVLREGQPDLLEFDIERDEVEDQSALSFHIKNYDIYYVSLTTFSDNAIKQVQNLLTKSKEHDYRGLIIDLRNNSGGLLNVVIDICGFFLPKNSLVASTKDKTGKITGEYRTSNNPIVTSEIPILILINNYTASAAEILAGCLKIHADTPNKNGKKLRAFLVGTKTFGKGSVQEVVPVSNNSAIKITTSLYYLPNNETIQGIGIEPDFEIDRLQPPTKQTQWFTKLYGREGVLKNSIKVHPTKEDDNKQEELTSPKKPKKWHERTKEALQKDNQLRAAIMLINMLHMAETCCPERITTRSKAVAFLKEMFVGGDDLEIEEVKP